MNKGAGQFLAVFFFENHIPDQESDQIMFENNTIDGFWKILKFSYTLWNWETLAVS